jgi:hypothetical protein
VVTYEEDDKYELVPRDAAAVEYHRPTKRTNGSIPLGSWSIGQHIIVRAHGSGSCSGVLGYEACVGNKGTAGSKGTDLEFLSGPSSQMYDVHIQSEIDSECDSEFTSAYFLKSRPKPTKFYSVRIGKCVFGIAQPLTSSESYGQ